MSVFLSFHLELLLQSRSMDRQALIHPGHNNSSEKLKKPLEREAKHPPVHFTGPADSARPQFFNQSEPCWHVAL